MLFDRISMCIGLTGGNVLKLAVLLGTTWSLPASYFEVQEERLTCLKAAAALTNLNNAACPSGHPLSCILAAP